MNGDRPGYVQVYHAGAGMRWVQLGEDILGVGLGDMFGSSVSLSSAGNILAVGAFGDWQDRPAYVRVFELKGDSIRSNWHQLGQDIDGESFGLQGLGDSFEVEIFVSLSDDGRTLAVGSNTNNANGTMSYNIRVYQNEGAGSNWTQLGQNFEIGSAIETQGLSVSLSADGSALAIGSMHVTGSGNYTGRMSVYDTDGSSWRQLGKVIECYPISYDWGLSVAISTHGNIVAIGAPAGLEEGDMAGYATVYHYTEVDGPTSGSWRRRGQKIHGEAPGDNFGKSVSLSEDGKTLAVGAISNDGCGESSGHVRIYKIDDDPGSNWTQLGQDIDGKASYDNSGFSVSLSADGETVAIGSVWNSDNGDYSGHVRVFSIAII